MWYGLSLALSLGIVTAACTGNGAANEPPSPAVEAAVPAAQDTIPYRLDQPDAAFALPGPLQEISGLTVLADGHLGAVQDEDGLLFVLDRETAVVIAEHRFHGNGDYEGVEAVGDAVWVLESDGTLSEVTGATGANPQRVRHETALRGRCDAEGLGYDAAHDRLLVACKENPGPELSGVRAIYAFGLQEKRLSEGPVFLLDRRALDGDGAEFRPSALAVHPRTGQVYVLSSVRKALAVLDPAGRLVAALALPAQLYPQPEALTFLPDGTLFIANEGGAGAATLLRFSETRFSEADP